VSDYLSQYGTSGQTREKVVRWILITLAVAAVVWVVDWGLTVYGTYNLRDVREEWRARHFFGLLREKQYDEAYRLWGCEPAKPCRDYSFQKFMEDWGPKGVVPDASVRKTHAVRHCKAGIIEVLDFGTGDPINLYVDSKDFTLSFAPWPVCDPRMKVPSP